MLARCLRLREQLDGGPCLWAEGTVEIDGECSEAHAWMASDLCIILVVLEPLGMSGSSVPAECGSRDDGTINGPTGTVSGDVRDPDVSGATSVSVEDRAGGAGGDEASGSGCICDCVCDCIVTSLRVALSDAAGERVLTLWIHRSTRSGAMHRGPPDTDCWSAAAHAAVGRRDVRVGTDEREVCEAAKRDGLVGGGEGCRDR